MVSSLSSLYIYMCVCIVESGKSLGCSLCASEAKLFRPCYTFALYCTFMLTFIRLCLRGEQQ